MKKVHPTEIPGYEGRGSELVEFLVCKLRFDKLAELHLTVAERYLEESRQELARGRKKLAWRFEQISWAEKRAAEEMRKVWEICAPFTE